MISKIITLIFILVLTQAVYDQTLARTICGYGAITHCTTAAIEAWNCPLCKTIQQLQQVVHIENTTTGVFGFIGYNKLRDRIILMWRGSVNIENLIEDLTIQKIPYTKCKNCEVHEGFQFAYLSVHTQTNQLVTQYLKKYPTASIVVGGHSLGGALAAYSALSLQLIFNKVTQLYTLGQPRIGNLNLAQFINTKIKNVYRIVHNRDAVPHIPFEWLEYHHAYNEVFYDATMTQYKMCDNSGEDPTCSNKFYPNYSNADHDFYFFEQAYSAC